MSLNTKIWTYILTNGTLEISGDEGLKVVSIQLTSGSATFEGDATIKNLPSSAISLAEDVPVTIGSDEQAGVIAYLKITATSGVVEIIGRQ